MKVALVSSSYHPYYKGGGEYSVKDLAEKLVTRETDTFVITAAHRAKVEIVDGVKVYRVLYPNVYWSYESENQPSYKKLVWHLIESYNVRVIRAVSPILKKEKPDVLHIRNIEDFSPYLAKVAHSLNIPVVVTLNSCTWLCPRGTMFRNGRNCANQCIACRVITYPKKYLSKNVDAVVGVSQFMIDTHRRHGYFSQATHQTIYTSAAVTPQVFPRAHHPGIQFGFIGRVHPIKGVAEIIQAFRRGAPPNARLYIAGEGPSEYYQHCKHLAEDSEEIIFLGQSSPNEFYCKVNLVIINSLVNEAFPRVLVEAYAHGRPVIAANTGGTPEMVISSQTGWVFDPFQPEQLEVLIQKTVSLSINQLEQMRANIAKFVEEHLPDDASQYVALYQELRKKYRR